MKTLVLILSVLLIVTPIFAVEPSAPTAQDGQSQVYLFTAIVATLILIAAIAQCNTTTTPQYKPPVEVKK
jgi:hypothetical protein